MTAVDWPGLVADLVEWFEREAYLTEVRARHEGRIEGQDIEAERQDARLRTFADAAVRQAQVAEARRRPLPPARTAAQISAEVAASWRRFERTDSEETAA